MPNRTITHEISHGADCVIVGQGIAGTLLAHFLLAAGKTVHVYEPGNASAASSVAAGIMNPITGRNFVKTWMADQIFPFARDTYRAIGNMLGDEFYQSLPILRALPDVKSENDWLARCGTNELDSYVYSFEKEHFAHLFKHNDQSAAPIKEQEAIFGEALRQTFHGEPAYAMINGGKCDLPKLTQAYRKWLQERNMLTGKVFDLGNLHPDQIECPIIFCEGHQGQGNRFFPTQPIQPAKGEVLLVKIPGYPFERSIVKHDIFIAPLGEGLYWVGSNYEHQYDDASPTPARREILEETLKAMLKLPYEVVAHKAAIRPTTKTRRPLLLRHEQYDKLFMFNGLGTKGATLGPWFAREMAQLVLGA